MSELIATTLAKSPEYYKDTIALIEKSFDYKGNNSFEEDFWPLINPHNHKRCHIVLDKEKKKVICHIGLKKREIRSGGKKYPIALLGGIVTDEEYRGKGIFKKLFHEVINKFIDQVAFFLLWTEKSDLYQKYDFFEFGTVIQTGLKNLTEGEALTHGFVKTDFSSLNEEDLLQVKRLYAHNFNKYISLNRRTRDWEILKGIKSADFYIKRNDRGEISLYFFINKGHDLSGVIHECSFFNDEEMLEKLSPYKLWLPEKHQSYIEHKLCLYVGLIKKGSNDLFKEFMTQVYSNEIFIKEIDHTVQFEFQNESFTLPLEDFIQMTLGPKPAKEFVRYAPWFSVSGLDSI